MVTLIRNFIEPERAGECEKHLYAVKVMLHYFHASGHLHYAKAVSYTHLDVYKRQTYCQHS